MILDLLGIVLRGVGFLVVVAFLTVAVMTVWDFMDVTREAPRCPDCGHRHGPAHRRACDPEWRL